MIINKPLPNNIQAEQSALGSILLDKEALMTTIGFLKPEDFYQKNHQNIYYSILDLVNKNQAVDLVTLSEELNKKKILEEVGGVTYLTNIINSVPTPVNIPHYNQIIKEKAVIRNTIIRLNEMLHLCYEDKDPKLIFERVRNMAVNISPEEEEKSLDELLKHTLISSSRGVKYRFKFESMNKVLGGVDICETIAIGGYTSQGKTSLALQLCKDFCEQSLKVLYCTSEMSDKETARRLLTNLQEKNIIDFRKGIFSENEKESLQELADLMVNTRKYLA
jgi:replicative DNA helicase